MVLEQAVLNHINNKNLTPFQGHSGEDKETWSYNLLISI